MSIFNKFVKILSHLWNFSTNESLEIKFIPNSLKWISQQECILVGCVPTTATRCQYQGGVSLCPETPPQGRPLGRNMGPDRKCHHTPSPRKNIGPDRKRHHTPLLTDRHLWKDYLPLRSVKIIFNDDGLLKHILSYKTASYLLCVNSVFPFPGLLPHDLRCQCSGSYCPCPWLYLGGFRNN